MKNKVKHFCVENTFNILLAAIIVLVVYGIKLFNLSLSIDNEAAISVPDSLYSAWLSMGRFGLVAIKKITGLDTYNPYLSTILFVVLIIISVIVWGILFSEFTDAKRLKKVYWIFPAIFFSSPIMAEQFGFLMQAFELLFAMDLLSVALYLIFKYLLGEGNILYLFINVFLVTFSISVYQALTTVYVTAAICIFILILDWDHNNYKLKNKDFWKMILILIVLFFISYGIYTLFSRCVFMILNIDPTNYTDGQMMWGKLDVISCLKNIAILIHDILVGNTIFYSFSYIVVVVLIFLNGFFRILSNKNNFVLYSLSHLALIITPFLMGIILGANPSKRVMLSLPLMLAFSLMYLCYNNISKKRMVAICYVLVAFFVTFTQIQTSSKLYYTEYITNKEQERIAINISNRVYELTESYTPETPVIFFGTLNLNRNNSCYKSSELELVGRSFFEVSYSPSHGTFLMQNYLKTMGIDFKYPSEEEINKVSAYQETMPSWPNEQSIQLVEGIVVIKLS